MSVKITTAALVVLPALLAGCSGEKPQGKDSATVTGKISGSKLSTQNVPPGTGLGHVYLVTKENRASRDNPSLPTAMVDREGKFQINDVAPGTYFLAFVPGGGGLPGASKQSQKGPYGGAFSIQKTPISITVPADAKGSKHDLGDIDLDKHAKKK